MLRFTNSMKDGTAWLKIEGKLVGPWVAECRAACAGWIDRDRPLALDLTEVSYVDADGVRLLRELVEQGVEIPVRSSFVSELLRLEKT